jgi:hypothetical protein
MKPASHRVAIIYLVLVAAICVLIGLKLTVWSAPGIVVAAYGKELVIDSRFLGEYRLGVERIRIGGESGREAIVDVRDPEGQLPDVFRLVEGVNHLELPDGERATFELRSEEPYVLTLCGNNGWGRTTCRSKSLRVPPG